MIGDDVDHGEERGGGQFFGDEGQRGGKYIRRRFQRRDLGR